MKKIVYICISALCIAALCYFINEKFMVKKSSLLSNGRIVYVKYKNSRGMLCSMDLSSGRIKTLYRNENIRAINSVSKIDSEWVLLSLDTFTKDTFISDNLVKFNIRTREAIYLGRAGVSTYMPSHEKILFLLFNEVRSGLYVADINKVDAAKFIIGCPTESYHRLIPVSDNEIFFQSNKTDEALYYKVLLYDLKTDRIKKLPVKNCSSPYVWRSRTNQMICWDPETEGRVLKSLDGKRIEKLPFNLYESPVIYIPEKDMLIFTVEVARYFWGCGYGPAYDLWVYDFATGKKELLSKGNGFGVGEGIYLPE